MAIITKYINGHGPYAYRATWTDDGQEWEYLGAEGRVDPDDLTDDETAELRAEGFGLARFRAEEEIEAGDLDTAKAIRAALPDDALSPLDRRSEATVRILDDEVSQAALTVAHGRAAESRLADTYGDPADLTSGERRRLDFDRTTVPHAMATKGLLQAEGVDDWTAHYDPTLEPGEHLDDLDEKRDDGGGSRTDRQDAEETRQAARMNKQAQAAQERQQSRMEQACEEGDGEACDELRALGWTDGEIEELKRYTEPVGRARSVTDERRQQGVAPSAQA